MASKNLPRARWLGGRFLDLVDEEPELLSAYDLPDYPGVSGDVTDTKVLEKHGRPFATLRLSPGGIELNEAKAADMNYYVAEALRLRLLHKKGTSTSRAFELIKSRYR